jgi:hypothetical protein
VAPLLEEALGLPDEVVKPFVAAVDGLTSAHHGGLDILNREESCAPPVRRGRFFLGHAREPLRLMADLFGRVRRTYPKPPPEAAGSP